MPLAELAEGSSSGVPHGLLRGVVEGLGNPSFRHPFSIEKLPLGSTAQDRVAELAVLQLDLISDSHPRNARYVANYATQKIKKGPPRIVLGVC